MATTPTDIVNQALQMMGDNAPVVTGTAPAFDTTPAGISAALLYAPGVAFVARQWEWDFARTTAALVVTGNTAPDPWLFEYRYPASAVQVWQLKPASLADPNDPRPTNWVRANALVGTVQTAVIWTDVPAAVAVFNDNPDPSVWDAGFREAVVRLLASEFAIALAGRPDTAGVLSQTASAALAVSRMRDS